MARFETMSDETIKKGECTDIYFVRTEETRRWENINPAVSMEVTESALPDAWAVFCGLSDVIAFLEGLPVAVDALPEGTILVDTDFGPGRVAIPVADYRCPAERSERGNPVAGIPCSGPVVVKIPDSVFENNRNKEGSEKNSEVLHYSMKIRNILDLFSFRTSTQIEQILICC